MNVFVDTSIVNNLLDLEENNVSNLSAQDAKYLKLILKGYVNPNKVTLFVNPSVKQQINNTEDERRKGKLLEKFNECHFTEFNLTIFPFHFPAKFMSDNEAAFIDQLCAKHPALLKDKKIIGDVAFNDNDNIDVLLTTDKDLAHQVSQVGKVRFRLPKELWEDLTNSHS